MREPWFWRQDGLLPLALQPLASLYAAIARRRVMAMPRQTLPVPLVCVGAATVGGAGKTPVARSVAALLREAGREPHCVLRGHGGRLAGPVRVDPSLHDAGDVGDEALLHARDGPTWMARRRIEGCRAAIDAGARSIVLDDALQHPGLAWSLALLVVDGGQGLGNGRVVPAGPLREPWPKAMAKADAVVLIGEDDAGIAARVAPKRLLRARLRPVGDGLAGRRVLAFAGIGYPAKFRRSLESIGADVVRFVTFADHHRYRERELFRLHAIAGRERLAMVTTAKDVMRIPTDWHARLHVQDLAVSWEDEAEMRRLVAAS